MDNLIKLHETDERLLEINELKGGLPELVNKEEQELNLINETQNNNLTIIYIFFNLIYRNFSIIFEQFRKKNGKKLEK